MTSTDWQLLEDEAYYFLVNSVKKVHKKAPKEEIYGAMFHNFYADTYVVYAPSVVVATERILEQVYKNYHNNRFFRQEESKHLKTTLRWSSADLAISAKEYNFEPPQVLLSLMDSKFSEYLTGQDGKVNERWDQIYKEFLFCFPRACKRAISDLIQQRIVMPDFLAIGDHNELIHLSLTKEEYQNNFLEV